MISNTPPPPPPPFPQKQSSELAHPESSCNLRLQKLITPDEIRFRRQPRVLSGSSVILLHGWWNRTPLPSLSITGPDARKRVERSETERQREREKRSPNRYESFHQSTLNSYRSNSKGRGGVENGLTQRGWRGRGGAERLERTTRRQCNYSQLPRPSAVRGIIPFCFHYWCRHSCLYTLPSLPSSPIHTCARVNSCIGDTRRRKVAKRRRNEGNSSRAGMFREGMRI